MKLDDGAGWGIGMPLRTGSHGGYWFNEPGGHGAGPAGVPPVVQALPQGLGVMSHSGVAAGPGVGLACAGCGVLLGRAVRGVARTDAAGRVGGAEAAAVGTAPSAAGEADGAAVGGADGSALAEDAADAGADGLDAAAEGAVEVAAGTAPWRGAVVELASTASQPATATKASAPAATAANRPLGPASRAVQAARPSIPAASSTPSGGPSLCSCCRSDIRLLPWSTMLSRGF
ncbi:hypothetical protein ACFYNO_39350 [Kitasatospora sp. NPDC006697]|uniref:hypothetical protein n=1 Tax=Kitasatospora sp. NPDC006697 TaxID=3364020 RepID=UPI0036CB36A6